jgi:hypothetical protein
MIDNNNQVKARIVTMMDNNNQFFRTRTDSSYLVNFVQAVKAYLRRMIFSQLIKNSSKITMKIKINKKGPLIKVHCMALQTSRIYLMYVSALLGGGED